MHDAYEARLSLIGNTQQDALNPINIAEAAGLDSTVVEAMGKGEPVYKWQAEKVLEAISQLLGYRSPLAMADIALKPDPPRFIELRSWHSFNIRDLAEEIAKTGPFIQQVGRADLAGPNEQRIRAWEVVIYRMLVGKPVACQDASLVLATLSEQIDRVYTLDELDIKLLDTSSQQ